MRVRRWLVVALALSPWSLLISDALARDLTFKDRVNAQEAIERVYYSHQIGATKPFEEAVPRTVLENKVRTYLEESVALETYWRTPVTAEALARETERMARNTRLPERLREIYAALGDDRQLILECLARPALVDRLARNFFAFDQRIHAAARQQAEDLRERFLQGDLLPSEEHPFRTTLEFVETRPGRTSRPRTIGSTVGEGGAPVRSLALDAEEYSRMRVLAPAVVGEIGPVTEDREAFIFSVILDDAVDSFTLGTYAIPKMSWDAWWASAVPDLAAASPPLPVSLTDLDLEPVERRVDVAVATIRCDAGDSWDLGLADALPDPRSGHTAIWTGTEMIIWGGFTGHALVNTGGKYDPATDSWEPMSRIDAPAPRVGHSAIWTGSRMIVWGGYIPGGATGLNTGGQYDPVADTWSATSTIDAPTARSGHTAVWTGTEMIVWGGVGDTMPYIVNTGGRYDPSANTWTTTSLADAPAARKGHTAVWTGARMIVWGGTGADNVSSLGSGSRYDPMTDTWLPTSTPAAPVARTGHTAVWTGDEMITWNGSDPGGRYDPVTDAWTVVSTIDAPSGGVGFTAVWTGREMIIWGGKSGNSQSWWGGRYDPVTDAWSFINAYNVVAGRYGHTAVWTGSQMIVWGGNGASSTLNTGGRYNPAADAWTPTSVTEDAPAAREKHTAVWTGNRMIVWGGVGAGFASVNTGGRYDPAIDVWTATSTMQAPVARVGHTALWTGSQMIVWGGFIASGATNSGGRYDPITDAWSSTSTAAAPAARGGHTAVWTGDRMIVWGGGDGATYFASGGRYDPVTDTWTSTSTTNAPAGRASHTVVWTGSQMIVWGGGNNNLIVPGGRYNPATDSWAPTSIVGAPTKRLHHTAIWTGTRMIIWGGSDDFLPPRILNTGGLYDPSTDTWAPTATNNAPTARMSHAAVWTGTQMVVWGGTGDQFQPTFFNSGSRYDPIANAWVATSTNGSPAGRYYHSAIWAGTRMIVWGGYGGDTGDLLRSGGRYSANPFFDPPTADAGPDRALECAGAQGTIVDLHGAGTGCGTLTYTWTGPFSEGGGSVQGSDASVTLPLGPNQIALRVDDTHGQSTTETITVTVQDTVAPVVACPSAAPDECTSASGTPVEVPVANATDACDPHPVVTNSRSTGGADASGRYPLGETLVTFVSQDQSGNQSSCTSVIAVRDTTPPAITCSGPLVAECTGPDGAQQSPVATAVDMCSPTVQIANSRTAGGADATASYALGTTPVTFSATDPSGNVATCSVPVTVRDTTPPTLTVLADQPSLWPPNHDLVPVNIAGQVRDICDPNPAVTLVAATSSEPDDAPGMGDGNTTGDIAGADPGTRDMSVGLRAERDGFGPGRVYQLTYQAVDASGNSAPAFAVVTVPHDQGSGPEPLLMRLELADTPGMVRLYWAGIPGALGYDVIAGDLSQAKIESGHLSLGAVRVLSRGTMETSLIEGASGEIPTVGSAIFYLIQSRTDRGGSGYGTESAPWPRVPDSCDAGCP